MAKICFILGSNWSYMKGGSEYQAKLIIDYLKKTRNHSIFYCYAGRKYDRTNVDGVKFYVLPRHKVLFKFGSPFFLDSLKMLMILKEIQPDFIYQRVGFAYTGIAAYYAKKNKCRMIWHIASEKDVKRLHFQWKDIRRPFNYINKKFLEYGIKNTNYIIGHSKNQNELLKKNYGRECDIVVLKFQPRPKHEIIKRDPVKVVWVSNFKKLKQPEIFIKLAEEFKDSKDIHFIMIGRAGPRNWQAKLNYKIDKLNNLEYLGEKPIDEVNGILRESHILVNTSIYEGLPNTFVQAWMRKVPVISLKVDPDNILREKNIGFCSESFDRMVSNIDKLLKDKALREEMGEKAQKYAFNNHCMENNIKNIINLFEMDSPHR